MQRRRSRAGSKIGCDMGFDMETLARLVRRARGRREEGGAGELRGLLHPAEEGWRILRHAYDLDLVAVDPQLRYISAVGQHAGDGLQHHDAGWGRLLALRQQAKTRSGGIRIEARRGAALRKLPLQLALLRLEGTPEIGRDQQRRRSGNAGGEQNGTQKKRYPRRPDCASPRLVEQLDPGGCSVTQRSRGIYSNRGHIQRLRVLKQRL